MLFSFGMVTGVSAGTMNINKNMNSWGGGGKEAMQMLQNTFQIKKFALHFDATYSSKECLLNLIQCDLFPATQKDQNV